MFYRKYKRNSTHAFVFVKSTCLPVDDGEHPIENVYDFKSHSVER